VAAAVAAFDRWSRTTPAERSLMLLKLADRIEVNAEDYAALEALNCGKPRHLVLRDEIPGIVDCIRFFAGAIRCCRGGGGGIPVWPYVNDPARSHRRRRLHSALELPADDGDLEDRAGPGGGQYGDLEAVGANATDRPEARQQHGRDLPAWSRQCCPRPGETVGNRLSTHPAVAMVSVTGDVGTGRKIISAATKTIKRTHLELGGKAPVIVLDDADLKAVSRRPHLRYYNAGQDCTAACRIYCGPRHYDNLVRTCHRRFRASTTRKQTMPRTS